MLYESVKKTITSTYFLNEISIEDQMMAPKEQSDLITSFLWYFIDPLSFTLENSSQQNILNLGQTKISLLSL